MKYFSLSILSLILFSVQTIAQEERKYIRKGVKEYNENKFEEAELNFRKALDLNSSSFEAGYNTGNALYKQDKPADAADKYMNLLNKDISENRKADLYYNIGNTYLKSKEYQKSIDAYKNALKLHPDDEDARYNLAWALAQLQEQQQNQDQNQQQDQQDEDEDQKEQNREQQADSNQDGENESMDTKNLSREEIERILQALEEKEEQVKEKVDREKAKAMSAPNEKDW